MTNQEAINILEQYREKPTLVNEIETVEEAVWLDEALEMAIKALEQEPKTGYISIDDVMSVFDDFMCGEVDEDGTETFLEMLKDKAESEG